MLIYCNGDSFTAGVGLSDFVIPEYPGVFTEAEIKTKNKSINRFRKFKPLYNDKFVDLEQVLLDPTNITFYNDFSKGRLKFGGVLAGILEKKYTYLSHLEKIDDRIKTINAARGGASMGGISYKTIIDLLNLKKEGTKVDLVIIQLTSDIRYEIFDHSHHNLMIDRPFSYFSNPLDNAISEAVVSKYTDEDLLIKFFFHLATLRETVLSITGKLPLIIDSINGDGIENRINQCRYKIQTSNEQWSSYFDNLVEHSMIHRAHLNFMKKCATFVETPYQYDGHYQEEVHKIVAQEIYKIL